MTLALPLPNLLSRDAMGEQGLTYGNWISIIGMVVGAVLVILGGMSHIITRLLDDKWKVNNERMTKMEDRQDQMDIDMNHIGSRLTGVEAVCRIHHRESHYPMEGD